MIFIKIPAGGGRTAQENAKLISEELYKIARPTRSGSDRVKYLFGWLTKGEECYLAVKEGMKVPVAKNSLKELIADLKVLRQTFFAGASDEEKEEIKDFIRGRDRFNFMDIVPSNIQVETPRQLKAKGWRLDDGETRWGNLAERIAGR